MSLKTVSSADSLITFDRTVNRPNNVSLTQFGGDVLAFKEDYLNFFRSLENGLSAGTVVSFVKLWKEKTNKACAAVFKKTRKAGCPDENATRIENKFRGNVAEIFAERLFSEYPAFFKTGTYVPVDPDHEEGVDAKAVSSISGLAVGIQIKNYDTGKPSIDVFRTAGDESDKYVHTLDAEQFKSFLTHPNQYLLSFTEAEPVIVESYRGRVEFLGPKWVDSLGLQGHRAEKTGRWLFFKEIADEIAAFSV